MKVMMKTSMLSAIFATLVFGCGAPEEGTSKGGIDLDTFNTDGKGDLAKSTKLLEDVPPDAEVKGRFDPRVRTYGYVVEARAGAVLTIDLEATAGKDAEGVEPGADLDTLLEIHGPFESIKSVGEKLISADDTSDTDLSVPTSTLEVEEDGKYFIAFTSFNDTGKGEYRLNVSCEGTSVQCMRPDFDKPCEKGRQFIQGAVIEGDQTWSQCEVVLLENATIQEGTTVTIAPGVTVKGNFLGEEPFGDVSLNVEGRLQAVGTADHPIVFTNFVEDLGWRGLSFSSRENLLAHVFVENAQFAARVGSTASVAIEHAVLEGKPETRTDFDTRGLDVLSEGDADLRFTTIKEFATGVRVDRSLLVSLAESVVRENGRGIHVIGDGRTHSRCGSGNTTPMTRVIDPKINKTDIIKNDGVGIFMERDNVFIQIEKSNIADNGGFAVDFQGTTLHEESFIRTSNIIRNNASNEETATVQVRSFHNRGGFDVSENFWNFFSDPQLGQTREGCRELTFTGFSPVLIEDAGPTQEKLTEPVQRDSFMAQQN